MKSGLVIITGAPNVGKSTFLNQILGFKLAITSDKPQTTRHRLLGVYNEEHAQILFFDTPGLHIPRCPLNKLMINTTLATLDEVDAVLFIAEASQLGIASGAKAAETVIRMGKPMVLALNKIDLLLRKEALLPFLDQASKWGDWTALIPISALNTDGIDQVLMELKLLLPEGKPFFPPNVITNLSERFLSAELIREKVFRLTKREVPYSVAVTIDEFLDPVIEGRTTAITATIYVERAGQKAIIIGKGGAMLKKIGIAARVDIEHLLGKPIYLHLFVKVQPKWSHQDMALRNFMNIY